MSGPCVRVGLRRLPAQPQGGQQPFVGGGAVRRHVRLRGFNWNGWSKGCGNASRGTTFEPGAGDSFYLTPSVAACRMCSRCMCPAYVFYPAEEPSEANGGAGRCLLPPRAEAAVRAGRCLLPPRVEACMPVPNTALAIPIQQRDGLHGGDAAGGGRGRRGHGMRS